MLLALYIGIAGALGSVSRYVVGLGLARVSARVPWGTFAVNVLGSMTIGFLMAVFAVRGQLDSRLRLALTTGFLGGFTTYSSFAFETVGMLEKDKIGLAALYVSMTLAAAGGACWVGIMAGRSLR